MNSNIVIIIYFSAYEPRVLKLSDEQNRIQEENFVAIKVLNRTLFLWLIRRAEYKRKTTGFFKFHFN